ncbi:Protein argonaute-3, partial [Taenia solium]|eukprot:TsM_000876200 transcript=TsM_000876200 gene=TsM_000876200
MRLLVPSPSVGSEYSSDLVSIASSLSLNAAGDGVSRQHLPSASPADAAKSEASSCRSASNPVQSEKAGLPTTKGKKNKNRPVKFKEDEMLPSRPGVGTTGTPIMVEVNCWDYVVADVLVSMYDITPKKLLSADGKKIEIKEEITGKFVKAIAERKCEEVFHDGGRILYSLGSLDGREGELLTFSERISDPLGNDDLTIEYTAKKVGSVSARLITDYLANRRSKTSELPQPAINMLDNLIKWVNRARYPYFAKSAIFYTEAVDRNPENLFDIYRGFSLSFRPQWKCRLNIDMVHRAFFSSGNLADVIYAKYFDRMYDPSNWEHIKEEILSLRVEASHYKNGDKSYKKRFVVYGLSKNSAEREIIPDLNKSIAQYFRERYGIDLQYPELPCVKTKKDREEYIPMELLEVLPFQNAREDPGVIAAAIIRCAAVRPTARFTTLREFIRDMDRRSRFISEFGLGFTNPDPIMVEARVLPRPSVRFSSGMPESVKGSWNQRAFHLPVSGPLNCAIVVMVRSRANQINKFKQQLQITAKRFGVELQMEEKSRRASIGDLPQQFKDFQKKKVNLAIFILNENAEYPHIKRQGDLYNFMFTQCIKRETIGKPNVLKNLMLKINGKMGGINWSVNGLSGRWKDKLVMVVGADVTHPGPTGSGRGFTKSVAAVVASISSDLMRYVAIVRQQDQMKEGKTTREEIDGMEGIFSDLLKTFGRRNNSLPDKVIVYRDGVSEGQFESVLRIELSAMQRACSNLRPDYEPGITFIVVQKRHHIRFNPLERGAKNVPPGTVVDSVITHHREFDFYLCSHEGIQGTSKPAHYHVLYDDNGWSADDLQQFTYG